MLTTAFSGRLRQACDDSTVIPAHGEGRQVTLAKRLSVSQEAVRKWFAGEAQPRPPKMKELSELLEVEESWLALGVAPELDRREKRRHNRNTNGAVLLLMGTIELAGGSTAQPSEKDPKSTYVDFYSIHRGQQYAFHVSLGREVAPAQFEVIVPRKFKDVRNIALIRSAPNRVDFIEMSAQAIDANKIKKGGDFSITMSSLEGKYITGRHVWHLVKDFEEFA